MIPDTSTLPQRRQDRSTSSLRRSRGERRPGIDGLRALAVMAVLLFHAGVSWMPGGFLGVDVFFVISGFLISSLLIGEWYERGRVDALHFWGRRARRLLPALFAMLVVVAAVGPRLAPDSAPRLRWDLGAAVAYVSNWAQILHHESYFASMGRPPLLQHLWSLAVEEQFYLVFPVLLLAGLRLARGRTNRVAVGALVAGALSAVAMALLWHRGADASRVYYGTDTHAVGLCVGVALGLVAPLHRQRRTVTTRASSVLDALGLAGLAVLAVLALRTGEFSAVVYRGGFALASVATALVVIAAARPTTHLAAALGIRPLEWIGQRSYAIYLWHWPVFVLTRPGLDIYLWGWPLMAVRLGIVFVLADVSWRAVEHPWQTGRAMAALRSMAPAARRRLVVLGTVGAVVLAFGVVVTRAPAASRLLVSTPAAAATVSLPILPPPPNTTVSPPSPDASAAAISQAPTVAMSQVASTTGPPTTAATAAAPPSTTPATVSSAASAAPALDGNVLAVGDSVLLAAKNALLSTFGGHIDVDAAVGRQVSDGLDILQSYVDKGTVSRAPIVVIDLGTNGPMSDAQFDRMAGMLAGARRVVVVNVRVPRRWESDSNSSIDDGVTRYPNMVLADWYGASAAPDLLESDGVHPNANGASVYAHLVGHAAGVS